tara:strand:+ start:1720 stop:1938 length:219 start_codon:yes stop_codon:yes gene_type:complete
MKYVIFDIQNIDLVNFTEVKETSRDTLRISLDGSKCVLKFEGATPDFLVGLQQYNYEDILAIMYSSEWTNNE